MAKKTEQQTAEQIDRMAGKVIGKSTPSGHQYGTVAIGQDRTKEGMDFVSRSKPGIPGNNPGGAHLSQGAGSYTQRRDVMAKPTSSEPILATHHGAIAGIPQDNKMQGDVRSFAAQTFSRIRAAQRGGGGAGRGDVPHHTFGSPRDL